MMIGFPPGGGADVLTRLACDWLSQRLGQAFVVENRPGAATNLATEAVARAPADGYTLLATTTSNLLNGALYEDLKYDFIRDIAPVASLSVQPLVSCAKSVGVPASKFTPSSPRRALSLGSARPALISALPRARPTSGVG
jgi:tripartite-type tricarboxylate transporter receptor subunit TctC